MLPLHVQRSELSYEAALSPSLSALIDTPGKVLSVLLSEFDGLDVDLSDVTLDDGPLEEKGLSCEVEKFDATVVLRADRIEIHFFSFEENRGGASEVMQAVWKVISTTSPEATAKTHSLLFEMDCDLPAGSYRELLEHFCPPPKSLPDGAETAVVYYLPADASKGFLESNFMLNRSAEVDGGVLLAATLVFDRSRPRPDELLRTAQERLADLLRNLAIPVVKDSTARI